MAKPPRDDDETLSPTEAPPATTGAPPSGEVGQQIGPYRLVEALGEGGMGEVWLADQSEPVKRQVALKVIKQGMDTRQVVVRFRAEQQALALMDHPTIARVYDAGATPRGRPYFVMEHVRGVPITRYCEQRRLTIPERLRLFMQVCDGVQHAHQKAVIHRDLKPGNVLVTTFDDRPLPKIIDFGIAKATAQKLTDATVHTQLGIMMGTPAYMSPEQADPTVLDVDTRTDVYALGVMLYELLVDSLPSNPTDMAQVSLDAVVRRIREDVPPNPSTRVTTTGHPSRELAERRRTDPRAMKRELAGDLDWITMKALEKDRERRYDSPQHLAADIERYLTNQPVLAGPPSAAYRTRKFVRRHTGAVAAAAAGLLMLIAFGVTMAVQAGRIASARDRAEAEAARANQEAQAKGYVSEFLTDLFTVSDPSEARGNSITARELLDRGAQKIEELEAQPETRADLMGTMGDVYRRLGLYPQAETLMERTVEERVRLLGPDHPDTLTSRHDLGNLYRAQGRYEEAESVRKEVLEARRRVLGEDHEATLLSMNNLASLYVLQGRFGDAEPLQLETLEIQRRVLGDDHPDTVGSMSNLAFLYEQQGRLDEAEPLYVGVLETRRRVTGDDHPETLNGMNNLANLLKALGRTDEAEPLYLEALETQRRIFGNEHPNTLMSMGNLAALYHQLERVDEAEPLYVETLETQKRILGAEHPYAAATMHNLARLYRDDGRFDESRSLFETSLRIDEKALGPKHPYVAEDLAEFAKLLRKMGDDAGAAALEARARAIRGE